MSAAYKIVTKFGPQNYRIYFQPIHLSGCIHVLLAINSILIISLQTVTSSILQWRLHVQRKQLLSCPIELKAFLSGLKTGSRLFLYSSVHALQAFYSLSHTYKGYLLW